MGRFLMVDVGAGTMDVLWYDTRQDLHYKAVVKSPVRYLAEKAAQLPDELLVTGVEMGGGAITSIFRQKAERARVILSVSAAATLHHDLDKVRSWGIVVVDDEQAEQLRRDGKLAHLDICDLDCERLRRIVDGFGVPFAFDAVAVCAQDHGAAPAGVSHLDFRHHLFKQRLEADPRPHRLLYRSDEIPAAMNRLQSLARSAGALPADQVYVMDSGMAAVVGASLDPLAGSPPFVVLDVATSHTVAAAMLGEEIAGFFEYHTQDITLGRLEELIVDLCEGNLSHRRILAEGGHGAYVRRAVGFKTVRVVIATGPRRRLVAGSRLPIVFGAPLGDNMMTGTLGLLESLRRRKALESIKHI